MRASLLYTTTNLEAHPYFLSLENLIIEQVTVPLFYLAGEHLSKPELEMAYLKTAQYRKRLMCISDFMQLLNQYIARQSNIEDRVKGHF